jgi:hypothetical protein
MHAAHRQGFLAAMVICAGALLSSCATTDDDATHEYLDEISAATVTAAGGGLAFARARTEYAINARDYVTVVPVDVNRAGRHVLYLYCYLWSTIDKPQTAKEPAQFELIADGRQIPLTPVSAAPRSIGFGEAPYPAPARHAVPLVSVTSREVLQFLVHAQELSVVATRDGLSERYELWTDHRSAIEEFLQGSPGGR